MDRSAQSSLLADGFSWILILLAIGGYALFGWSLYLLHTVPTAPPACTHEASPSPGAVPEELFVGITSTVGHYTGVLHPYPIPSDSNSAICVIRASAGAVLRHYPLGDKQALQALIAADGVLYYVLNDADLSSQLCAMAARTGKTLWCRLVSITIPRPFQGSPLVLRDHILYVVSQSSVSFSVEAFRASDGAPLWEHTPVTGFAAGANGVVYIANTNNQVCAIQAGDGAQRRCAAQATPVAMTADEQALYVLGQDGSVVAFQASDATILWQHTLPFKPVVSSSSFSFAFIVAGGILSIAARGLSAASDVLTALSASDGTTLWSTSPTFGLSTTASPGIVYQGGQETLQALARTTGQPIWQQNFSPAQSQYQLVAGGSMLYLLGSQGDLFAFSTQDGRLLWKHTQCVASNSTTQPTSGAFHGCWGTDPLDLGPNWYTTSSINHGLSGQGILAVGNP